MPNWEHFRGLLFSQLPTGLFLFGAKPCIENNSMHKRTVIGGQFARRGEEDASANPDPAEEQYNGTAS
jgi:hypothetical protein